MDTGTRRAVLGQKEQLCSLRSTKSGQKLWGGPHPIYTLCMASGTLRAISIVILALGGSELPVTNGIQAR